jgi:hypothetical protein
MPAKKGLDLGAKLGPPIARLSSLSTETWEGPWRLIRGLV